MTVKPSIPHPFINRLSEHLEKFSHSFAKWAGSAAGFIVALVSMLIWLLIGELYQFSNKWENALTIYIGVLTFLMIFLMQRSQIKELGALHLKLNELIVATKGADNSLIRVEQMTEKEISEVHQNHLDIVDVL